MNPEAPTEIVLHSAHVHPSAYTAVRVDVEFTHCDSGARIVRPAFWDGGNTWRVRFVSPGPKGLWLWRSYCSVEDPGISGATGECAAPPVRALLRMSRNCRIAEWSDGTPWLMVADTAWALPFRATPKEAERYAKARSAQGFNAALLMVVQPDRDADGPSDRTAKAGFARAFDDLPEARLEKLRPAYFRELDALMEILDRHGIVPVFQPVFHGYGWMGKRAAGTAICAEDAARFARYLVARYGARPAIWLVGGDGDGLDAGVAAAGEAVEMCDAYGQPTGIHYGPNRKTDAHQAEPWLDFQWCQTGHNGEHLPERVATMLFQNPPKGVANGEPTYERIGAPDRAVGWWQGREAWANLFCGGTMGVVYGAGSLWQWKRACEADLWDPWCQAAGCSWEDALGFDGAAFPGALAKVFAGLSLADAAPDATFTYARRALVSPGKWAAVYLEEGGSVAVLHADAPARYTVFDARDGSVKTRGTRDAGVMVQAGSGPAVVIFADR